MRQTKLESSIEIFFNYLSGFLLAWAAYAFIVIPVPGFSESPFWVTSFFTAISIVRSFFWRRFFNAGLHTAVHKILSNWRLQP